ncbi:uncharacterized protein C8orf74 homolog [Saccostrea echinata]|uniref:uncharacterized protein C8orf74 homolog n=1 Tax=Saccostrea echinata TaxID=191078 RepID=UPI002A828BE1|nr:uncharacterized protein C8orf74 homolog [Saccostrea echinata]
MAVTLSESIVKNISTLPKDEGKEFLAKQLGLKCLQDDENLRNAIYTDFLYDNLIYAVEKGFTWKQVCTVVTFCDGILKDSEGKDLTESLQFLKLQSFELADILGERNFPIYMDYVFLTFLRHFKLFKYVFSKNRDILKPNVAMTIETPVDPGDMKTSKPEAVWEYEKRYEDIQRTEAEQANKRLEERAKTIEAAEKQTKERIDKVSHVQTPLTKEKVSELIGEVIGSYTSLLVEKVKCNIKDVQEDLEFKLERTSLPRPQALGPPPRFNLKPKTPVPTPKKTPPKSPKNGRKKSGNSRPRSRNK